MGEKTTSQPHNTVDNRRVADEAISWMSHGFEELARLQGKWMEQAEAAVEESARMWKESIVQAGQLSAELRRMAIESTRRTAEIWAPRS